MSAREEPQAIAKLRNDLKEAEWFMDTIGTNYTAQRDRQRAADILAAYDALAAERDEAVELADRRLAFMRAEGDVVNQVLEAVRSHMKSGDTVVTCVTRLSGVMATLEETIKRLADAQGALSMCHQGAEYMLWMLRKAKEQQEAAERERDALREVVNKALEWAQAEEMWQRAIDARAPQDADHVSDLLEERRQVLLDTIRALGATQP